MHRQLNYSQQPRAYWLRERQPEPINAQHPSAYLECGGRGAVRVRVRVRARLCSRDGGMGVGGMGVGVGVSRLKLSRLLDPAVPT